MMKNTLINEQTSRVRNQTQRRSVKDMINDKITNTSLNGRGMPGNQEHCEELWEREDLDQLDHIRGRLDRLRGPVYLVETTSMQLLGPERAIATQNSQNCSNILTVDSVPPNEERRFAAEEGFVRLPGQ